MYQRTYQAKDGLYALEKYQNVVKYMILFTLAFSSPSMFALSASINHDSSSLSDVDPVFDILLGASWTEFTRCIAPRRIHVELPWKSHINLDEVHCRVALFLLITTRLVLLSIHE